MATDRFVGVNYRLVEDIIDFFGCKGTKFDDGTWGINSFGGSALTRGIPESIMESVRGSIASEVEDGNGDRIAQLQLNPRYAVILYLEGILTCEHLRYTIEGVDFIDIPNVDVDGRILTVRVLADPEYAIATADNEGNVL